MEHGLLKKVFLTSVLISLTIAPQDVLEAEGIKRGVSTGIYTPAQVNLNAGLTENTKLSVDKFLPEAGNHALSNVDQLYFECTADQGLSSITEFSQFADYLGGALTLQLQDSGMYSDNSTTVISGELLSTELFFDQLIGSNYSGGTWSISLKLSSSFNHEEIFNVEHSFPIKKEAQRCQAMAEEFVTGVQQLMIEILGSKRFTSLISSE